MRAIWTFEVNDFIDPRGIYNINWVEILLVYEISAPVNAMNNICFNILVGNRPQYGLIHFNERLKGQTLSPLTISKFQLDTRCRCRCACSFCIVCPLPGFFFSFYFFSPHFPTFYIILRWLRWLWALTFPLHTAELVVRKQYFTFATSMT